MIIIIFIHTNVIQQLSYLYPYNTYYPSPPIPNITHIHQLSLSSYHPLYPYLHTIQLFPYYQHYP